MFKPFELSVLLFVLIIIASNAMSIPLIRRGQDNITVTVEGEIVFCSFLPRDYGGNIGESEDTAVAFCTENSVNAPGARIFPSRFIKSSHFLAGDGYVQITGTINRDAYGLDENDGGGQYDSVGAPPDATCYGYNKFVNLVEPDIEHFCIRCCTDTSKCHTGESTRGCEYVIPGDYS